MLWLAGKSFFWGMCSIGIDTYRIVCFDWKFCICCFDYLRTDCITECFCFITSFILVFRVRCFFGGYLFDTFFIFWGLWICCQKDIMLTVHVVFWGFFLGIFVCSIFNLLRIRNLFLERCVLTMFLCLQISFYLVQLLALSASFLR
jgi:hypothetical protein